MRKIPILDRVLVECLDERFPERCPDPEWSDREVWMYTGRRQVVSFLLDQLKEQEQTLFNKE